MPNANGASALRPSHALRIVSLLPSASEILCSLGLGSQLVAISHECDYPASITHLPRITRSIIPEGLSPKQIDTAVIEAVRAGKALYQVDAEQLRTLRPDIIVTQGVCTVCAVSDETVGNTLAMLPEVMHDCHIVSLSGTTVAGIWHDVAQVAAAAGCSARAEACIQQWHKDWQDLQTSTPTPTRVVVLEWPEPPFSAGHWVPEMVAAAGGVELMCQAGEVSSRFSWQQLRQADPELLVMAACGYDVATNRRFAEELYHHPEIGLASAQPLRALQQGKVLAVDANSYFSRPSPRVLAGARLLRDYLQAGKTVAGHLEEVAPANR